jgi:hypothetical protein
MFGVRLPGWVAFLLFRSALPLAIFISDWKTAFNNGLFQKLITCMKFQKPMANNGAKIYFYTSIE